MVGVPARQRGWMSRHGHRPEAATPDGLMRCPESGPALPRGRAGHAPLPRPGRGGAAAAGAGGREGRRTTSSSRTDERRRVDTVGRLGKDRISPWRLSGDAQGLIGVPDQRCRSSREHRRGPSRRSAETRRVATTAAQAAPDEGPSRAPGCGGTSRSTSERPPRRGWLPSREGSSTLRSAKVRPSEASLPDHQSRRKSSHARGDSPPS